MSGLASVGQPDWLGSLLPHATSLTVAIAPTIVFLTALVVVDSYKLVPLRSVLTMLAVGALAALASLLIERLLQQSLETSTSVMTRYAGPVIEEVLKGAPLVLLFLRHRVGFLVDATIFGFAIGTGFALVENLHYFVVLEQRELALWVLRGFGTAVMHGGMTALMALLSKDFTDRLGTLQWSAYAPGLIAAIALHSLFNHFLLSPVASALALLIGLPPILAVVFMRSESATRSWLDTGFDTDAELLEILHSGKMTDSHIGRYLATLRGRFSGEDLADMLCLIRLRLELSVQAKGILLARQEGFDARPDSETPERLAELRHLEASIGPTGVRALEPIFSISSRDLWQFYIVRERPTFT